MPQLLSMSGGTILDADNSSTLSGTLTQAGNITIDVADDKTLTYSGAADQPWSIHPDPERRRDTCEWRPDP